MAYNSKLGAVLQITNQERSIWIDSLTSWPEGYYGKKVEVTGIVIKMHDLPVYIEKEGELAKSGIPVPEGTDLYSASKRYLLKNAKWKLIE